jgi:hypothetical protein
MRPISSPAVRRLRLGRGTIGASLLLFVLLVASCGSEPPSDEALIRQFESNAQRYNQVIAMLSQDRKVGTIGRDFLFEADKPFVGADVSQLEITEDRLAEYKRLLALSGTVRLDRYGDEVVSFMSWASGFARNTHHKGIAWITRPLAGGGERRYSRIRDNWYLYQD